MALQGTNISASTLDGAINASVTSLAVVSAASFPTGGDFWIRIDDEILKVTGVSSNTFTVVRGESGGGASAAASHSSGATVTGVLTSQAITQLRADITRWGTHATLAGLTDMKSGDVFYPDGTDTPYDKFIYDGSAWLPWFGVAKCTPFSSTGYSWLAGTMTAASAGGTVKITCPADGAVIRPFTKAVPSAPYTITMLIDMVTSGSSASEFSAGFGLVGASHTSGYPMVHWRWNPSGPTEIQGNKWTNAGSVASYTPDSVAMQLQRHMWLRVADDATNRSFSWSLDGVNWQTTLTHSNTDFLTPATIGPAIMNNSGAEAYVWILHWEQS